MNKPTLLLICAATVIGLAAPVASAQVNVTASQGATIGWNSLDSTVADTTGYYYPSVLKTRSYDGTGTTNASYSWKGYVQFKEKQGEQLYLPGTG